MFSGEAKLLDRSNVSINNGGKYEKITGKNIVLATGARARELLAWKQMETLFGPISML